MQANVSLFSNTKTANTCLAAAKQRAENLSLLGVKSVIELCVGPSLALLEQVYRQQGISCSGNDIDPRWKEYYPRGNWIIGDAREVSHLSLLPFDAAVIAPPLSRGCSGRREDALGVSEVQPSFESFLSLPNKVHVYVLPGKTLSLKQDKADLHAFLAKVKVKHPTKLVDVIPLKDKVTKYVDVYVY